jgi:hypothetical protein
MSNRLPNSLPELMFHTAPGCDLPAHRQSISVLMQAIALGGADPTSFGMVKFSCGCTCRIEVL